MDQIQARLNLEADLERIAGIIEQECWKVELWADGAPGMFATILSDIDKESYVFRIACDGYPEMSPSIRCVDPDTKNQDISRAWPNCEGFRPPPEADLCLNISREALTRTHPDWQRDPRIAWDPSGNPIWRVLASLQDRLNDKTKYHGRHR